MEREGSNNVEPQISQEMMEEMELMQEDDEADRTLDGLELNDAYHDAYGAPEIKEGQNAHSFLHKAAFSSGDTTRTTFLSESELGRPLFSVRFMLDMEDIVLHHINPVILGLGLDPRQHNKIANYFKDKSRNVTDSGMSNKGFSMNLNVTRKMDATRMRVKSEPPYVKGGVK